MLIDEECNGGNWQQASARSRKTWEGPGLALAGTMPMHQGGSTRRGIVNGILGDMMNSNMTANTAGSTPIEQTAEIESEFDPCTEAFSVGDWRVDPLRNALQESHGNTHRHLEPRLAKLLCYLASHAQEVVERDTLVAVLWPRVIVNENSLTRAVSELRKLLCLPSNPDLVYIETIPKRGYRLCLEVQQAEQPKPVPDSKQSCAKAPASWHAPAAWRQMRESTVAAFCLSLALAFLLQFEGSHESGQISQQPLFAMNDEVVYSTAQQRLRDEIVPSSTLATIHNESADNTTQPVLAQDGERFAFIQYDHSGSTLYLGEIASSFDPVPVFNSTELLYNLAWSPLENALLFASKPAMTTTAWFEGDEQAQAKLYSFDLESFRLSVLVEEVPTTQPASEGELSLT